MRALVIGDTMLDVYVYGKVHRVAFEAQCPVFQGVASKCHLGAATNVAANLRRYGLDVDLVSLIGDDEVGVLVEKLCDERGIVMFCSFRGGQRLRERFCETVTGHQIFRCDYDPPDYMQPEEAVNLIHDAVEKRIRYDAVVISDYGYSVVSQKVLDALQPKSYGLLAIDISERNADKLTGTMDLAIVNGRISHKVSMETKERIVTHGASGLDYYRDGFRLFHLSATSGHPICTVGAGDSVLAAAVYAKLKGLDGAAMAGFANKQAGKLVGEHGTCCPTEPLTEVTDDNQG